jgi:glycosyltransferase involved in cell wall biosynthesis
MTSKLTEPQTPTFAEAPRADPLVSVCIATYNRKDFLAKTLETLQHQTLSDYELLVCDDSSTDGTYEFLESLQWPNLTVLRNDSNRNHCGTYTRLFSQARGKYIAMQHDHDLYEPTFLESMVATMEKHPTAGLVCCAYHVLDGDKLILNPWIREFEFFPESGVLSGAHALKVLASETSTPIAAMGTVFRKEIVDQVGGYRPDWFLGSDEDLYSRTAIVADFAFCPQRLFKMRTRPVERHPVLGSWRSLYTLHEFRADLARRVLPGRWVTRRGRVFRLRVLRNLGLLRESIHLWIHGDEQRLRQAFDFESIPTLPTGKRFLSLPEEFIFRFWIMILTRTTALGTAIGEIRRRRKAGVRSAPK